MVVKISFVDEEKKLENLVLCPVFKWHICGIK